MILSWNKYYKVEVMISTQMEIHIYSCYPGQTWLKVIQVGRKEMASSGVNWEQASYNPMRSSDRLSGMNVCGMAMQRNSFENSYYVPPIVQNHCKILL